MPRPRDARVPQDMLADADTAEYTTPATAPDAQLSARYDAARWRRASQHQAARHPPPRHTTASNTTHRSRGQRSAAPATTSATRSAQQAPACAVSVNRRDRRRPPARGPQGLVPDERALAADVSRQARHSAAGARTPPGSRPSATSPVRRAPASGCGRRAP
ncbi:hypothetical protein FQR65_LT20567 [Abscondita terminalis]|nr:hypothetical protein FQR65_LT20567 [Abscondita terminalis]